MFYGANIAERWSNSLTFNKLHSLRLTRAAAAAAAAAVAADAGERRLWLNQSASRRVYCCLSLTRSCRRLMETILYMIYFDVLWFVPSTGLAWRHAQTLNRTLPAVSDLLSRHPLTAYWAAVDDHCIYNKFQSFNAYFHVVTAVYESKAVNTIAIRLRYDYDTTIIRSQIAIVI